MEWLFLASHDCTASEDMAGRKNHSRKVRRSHAKESSKTRKNAQNNVARKMATMEKNRQRKRKSRLDKARSEAILPNPAAAHVCTVHPSKHSTKEANLAGCRQNDGEKTFQRR